MDSGNNGHWSSPFSLYNTASGDSQYSSYVPLLPGQTIPGLGHKSSKLFGGEVSQKKSRFQDLWKGQSSTVKANGTTTADEASEFSGSDEIHEEINPMADCGSILQTTAKLDDAKRKRLIAADVRARVAIPYNLTFTSKPHAPSHTQDDSPPIHEQEFDKEPLATTVAEASELECGVSSLNNDEEEGQAGSCVEDPPPIPSAEKTQSTKAANRNPRRRRLEPTTQKAEKMEQDWWRSRKTQRSARLSSRQTRDTENTDESDTATQRGQTQTAGYGELTTGHRTITPRKGIKPARSEVALVSTNRFDILGQESYDDTEEDGSELDPADTVQDEDTTGDMDQREEEPFAPTEAPMSELYSKELGPQMSITTDFNQTPTPIDTGSVTKKKRTKKKKRPTDSTAGDDGDQHTQASSVKGDTSDSSRLDLQQPRTGSSTLNITDAALIMKSFMAGQATAKQRSYKDRAIELTGGLSSMSKTDPEYAEVKSEIEENTRLLVADIKSTVWGKGTSTT